MSTLIDSLKRLERAGSENSRMTDKLREAAREVACHVSDTVPVGVPLPRGYEVVSLRHPDDYFTFYSYLRARKTDDEDGYAASSVFFDGGVIQPTPSRDQILQFAADIATGWLDEVAELMEKRADKSAESVATLQRAQIAA